MEGMAGNILMDLRQRLQNGLTRQSNREAADAGREIANLIATGRILFALVAVLAIANTVTGK